MDVDIAELAAASGVSVRTGTMVRELAGWSGLARLA